MSTQRICDFVDRRSNRDIFLFIIWLVFITVTKSIYCAVRNESWTVIHVNFNIESVTCHGLWGYECLCIGRYVSGFWRDLRHLALVQSTPLASLVLITCLARRKSRDITIVTILDDLYIYIYIYHELCPCVIDYNKSATLHNGEFETV